MPGGTLDRGKPFCRLEVYEPEGTEPRLVISPNIFLDNERPSDNNQVSSDIYLTSLNINSQLHGKPNVCELVIKHNPNNAPAINMDSKVKVYLGYYNIDLSQGAEYSLVFTGYVTRLEVYLQRTEIECRSDLYKLSSLRKKIAFSRMMTIDEIIRQLSITEGNLIEATNGIVQSNINKQPGFAISEKKSILDYIQLLANYNGLIVYTDVKDEFHTSAWVPGDLNDRTNEQDIEWLTARGKTESNSTDLYKHELTFGKDLVACDFELSLGKASSVEIIGFKPFSDDTVHTIDPPKIEYTPSTGGDPELPKKVYKLSHVIREDAEKIAENLYNYLNRQLVCKTKVLGAPQVRLGDGVQIKGNIYDTPPFENFEFKDDGGSKVDLDSKIFQVIKVNHRFNDAEGFVTRFELGEGIAAVGVGPEAGGTGAAGAGTGAGITAEGVEFTGVGEASAISELPIQIKNAKWDKEEARQGDTLTLTADVEGAPDGTQGEIEIYEHDVDGIHDLIATLPVDVVNNKIKTTWEYEYHEDTDEIPTDEELKKYGRSYNPPEYFFAVKVRDAEDISGILLYKDYVEIYLKNPAGEPIADEDYILTLPDGTDIEGKVDSEGYAKVEGIPPGKVSVRFPNI